MTDKKPTLSEKDLKNEIKRYIENKDYEGAENLTKSFGSQIEGFDVNNELLKIKKLKPKEE